MSIAEQMFYFIRNEIKGEPLPDKFKYDIQRIYSISRRHDIAHLVGDALFRNKLLHKDKIGDAFKKQMMLAVLRYEQQNAELKRVCKALESEKINYILLKGTELRKLYPESWLRTSCDIDILVKKEDFFKATKYLVKTLHYRQEEYGSHDVSLYSASNVHIELHYSLIEDKFLDSVDKVLNKVWDYALPVNNTRYSLSDEMFYFYHLAHMAKHFQCGGCGIRPFIDLWFLNHKFEFDKDKRNALLKEGGLLKFAEVSEKLSERWLGDGEHDETTVLLQEYILNGGVYGNIQNRATVSKGLSKNKSIFSYLWKPYGELKFWYPNLAKHKWLLPYYEIKRWFAIVFGGALFYKFKEKKVLKKTETEKLDKSDKLLSDLGLRKD